MFRILIGLLTLGLLCGCGGKKDFERLTFSGTMEMTEHVLGIKAVGRLTTLSVKEGDAVTQGQLLATFDRFEQNKKDYERAGVLFKNGGANQQSLENARLAMEDQEVVSPLNGVVLVKSAETGEVIPAGGAVVVIGDPTDQWVKIFVTEDLMHQLAIGRRATILLDGSNRQYRGHVSFIADKAEFTPRNVQTPDERVTQNFAIKVAVDDADANLHAGVAADVKFD